LPALNQSLAVFLARLSARFINVPAESMDEGIRDGLRSLAEFLEVDRCSLARITAGGEVSVVGCYAAPGVTSVPTGGAGVQLPWYANELAHGRVVQISRPADLPPQATVERAYMRDSGAKSHLGIPITVGGMPLCALSVTTFRRRMDFPQELVTSIRLMGEVLANALARGESEGRLRRMEAELSHLTRVATVGQLAASIAHEINQPLCAILSNARAALRLLGQGKAAVGEVRAALRDIAADSNRAGEIVSRSHRLLKPRELALQRVALNDIVRDLLVLMHGEILIRQVRVRLELADELPTVVGDPVQLQQVVLNLFVNAADATALVSGREREMTIRTEVVDGQVRVLVSDNGVGLTRDVAAKMFDPFFTTKTSGLGMGLAINRTIMDAHGGNLWAFANGDHGSTVGFSIPCAPAPVVKHRAARPRQRHVPSPG
jgi:signal transduction histidine kinase